MLLLKNLHIERHGQRLFPALNLHCQMGSAWQIVGANGSGKSSLLRVLAGLAKARRGVIQWQGHSTADSQHLLRQHSLYLSHELHLKARLTVFENLRYFAALQGPFDAARLSKALHDFHLDPLAQRLVSSLSAGQQRRVNLAKCALSQASLWLLDEPFTALDQQQAHNLAQHINRFVAQRGLVLFTSHQAIDACRCHQYVLEEGVTRHEDV